MLVGANVLGTLLVELRDELRQLGRGPLRTVEPPAIPDFLLHGRAIGIVDLAGSAELCPSRPASGR